MPVPLRWISPAGEKSWIFMGGPPDSVAEALCVSCPSSAWAREGCAHTLVSGGCLGVRPRSSQVASAPTSRPTTPATPPTHHAVRETAVCRIGLSNGFVEAWNSAISHLPSSLTSVQLHLEGTTKSEPSRNLYVSRELP